MTEIVNCIGCGLCSSLKGNPLKYCKNTGTLNPFGLERVEVDVYCPLLVDYKELYKDFFNKEMSNKQMGQTLDITISNSKDPVKRLNGASGGVITEIFSYLLRTNKVDAVIGAFQPQTDDFRRVYPKIITDPDELEILSGSIYITVPMLQVLSSLDPNLKYAISLVPEQTAVIRRLQLDGNQKANSIKFVAGLMTGTTLKSESIDFLLRRERLSGKSISFFKWRYGNWPGKLRIGFSDGSSFEQDKIYYNFLIPSFIAPHSLSSHDFYNEFADVCVGDAWDDELEKRKKGISLLITRTKIGQSILQEMVEDKLIETKTIPEDYAIKMHSHMYEFKKRGSFIRTRIIKNNLPFFNHGYEILEISNARIRIESVLKVIFAFSQSRFYLLILSIIPLNFTGAIFNFLRLTWKNKTIKIKRKNRVLIK
ncbi:Coenzyme F420 hydrogenase/dehydrogenase, beta subunit C-terminal domain [Alphaproteobacteria bacterium]|nr:Coenzyme F420 hydrogenase/dehydrogenase, beta subunit C-terminal domain [Alphaproteobacteria bacterium]